MNHIAISNLAWLPHEDKQVFELLSRLAIRNIEVSPFRETADLKALKRESAQTQLETTRQYKIKISSMQALLFRHPQLSLFKDRTTREKTFSHLLKIFSYANMLGVKTLIFGSPKNKLRGAIPYLEAFKIATDFFGSLADTTTKYNINFCIEPTPSVYGADFLTNTKEVIELISAIDSKNMKLNLDIGSSILNKENIEKIIMDHTKIIGHIHISEPYLHVIKQDYLFHKKVAHVLKSIAYSNMISIEMLPQQEKNLESISETLSFINEIYRQ